MYKYIVIMTPGLVLDIAGMGAFFAAHFLQKRTFTCLSS